VLSHALFTIVLFTIIMSQASSLSVLMTLTKPCKTKAPTTWKVGQLTDGRFAAKGPKDRKIFFKSYDDMQEFITRYIFRFGFDGTMSHTMRTRLGVA
jgi:hypothetical protein